MSQLDEFNRKLAAEQEARDREDLRKVIGTAEGRRFIWSILSSSQVYGRAFTGDPLTTAHNEGRRWVGIELLERIETDVPGSYLAMLREALDEQTAIESSRKLLAEQDAKADEQGGR
ncbi:Bbp19 family protein [Microvirga sp. G4-2]|uniref:Bbp19 family protein n=1 Tax=Microvirga sp. G4-2 TaxID=3434467 RepID=UPI00404445A3